MNFFPDRAFIIIIKFKESFLHHFRKCFRNGETSLILQHTTHSYSESFMLNYVVVSSNIPRTPFLKEISKYFKSCLLIVNKRFITAWFMVCKKNAKIWRKIFLTTMLGKSICGFLFITAWLIPWVMDGGVDIQIWKLAANILYKLLRKRQECGPPTWGFGVRLNNIAL